MAGKMISVAMVPPVRPPITARPSGAVCEPASPRPTAIGNIPAIIAQPVIRIGRRRLAAPETAASGTRAPPIRSRSAKVTSRIALATATPIAMIAPMSNSMFNVVRVIQSATATPEITAGIVRTIASESRKD